MPATFDEPGEEWPPGTAVVIGAGVVGQAIALRLQRRGHITTMIDAHAAPRGASWGNAGHIAVEQVAPLASRTVLRALPRRLFARGGPVALPWGAMAAWLPFGLRLIGASGPRRFEAGRDALGALLREALPAWRRLLDDISAGVLLREEGHFVLWESAASAAAGRASWIAADTGTATVRDATDAELAELRALIKAPIAGGVRFEGSAQIADMGMLADALRDAFIAAGGTLRTGRVMRLMHDGDSSSVRAEVVTGGTAIDPCRHINPVSWRHEAAGHDVNAAIIEADLIVVAAGARADKLLCPLGYAVPLIAERGYHIQSAATDWPADMPPVVFEDRATIVTRFHDGLRAASFTEFARADRPPDARKWARLRAHVAALGLSFELPGKAWAGARPTLPDYLPAIGRSRRAPRIVYAFGHQHLGLTLAAATAEAVAALVRGEPPPFDLAPYDLERFGRRWRRT